MFKDSLKHMKAMMENPFAVFRFHQWSFMGFDQRKNDCELQDTQKFFKCLNLMLNLKTG